MFTDLHKKASKFVIDNSPSILTAIAVTGTVTTAVLAGQASFKAKDLIDNEELTMGNDGYGYGNLTDRQKVEMVWHLYIPAAGTALLTVACIVGANRVGNRRAAAMAAAYSISEKAFAEYQDKVVEKIGANKERVVRDEIAQDQVKRAGNSEIVIMGGGDVLCFESFTSRYFTSNMETLKKAQNDTNYQIINDFYASLTDFYNRIGLGKTDVSDDLGWTPERQLDLEFSTVLAEDGRPCLVLGYVTKPQANYYKVN